MAGKVVRAADFSWQSHPQFKDVSTKVLLGSADNPAFSTHLVRVEPGASIDMHIHEGTAEVFFVVFGTGTCVMDGQESKFLPGSCASAPADVPHSIHNTGTAPMELLCIFAPPRA